MIDVYTWPTPNGHKVHIMLHETGLETLAEHRRTSNAHSDQAWEIMYGKTQGQQGQKR